MILVKAPMKIIASLTSGELDLNRPLASALGAGCGGGKGDLLNRVHTGGNVTEEPVAILVEVVLGVEAVNRDVVSARGQPVDRRVARTGRRGRAYTRQHGQEINGISGLKREFGDLFGLYCSRDVGCLGLQDLSGALHHNRFAPLAYFERYVSGRGDADVHLYVLQDDLLESRGFDTHGVSARTEGGHGVS